MPPKKAAPGGGGPPKPLPPPNMAMWTAEACEAVDVDANAEKLAEYTPTGVFQTDYLAYSKILGTPIHPQLLRTWEAIRFEEEERKRAEEAAKAAEGLISVSLGADKKKRKRKKAAAAVAGESKVLTDEDLFDLAAKSEVAVRGMVLDATSAKILTRLLPQCSNVTSLKFWQAGLTHAQLVALAGALPSSQVSKLYVDWNPLVSEEHKGDDGTSTAEPLSTVFAKFVTDDSPLSFLSLRGNNLGAAGAAALAAKLRVNKSINSVNLFDCALGDEGAMAIVSALRDNRAIKSLCLGKNQISDTSVPVIAASLMHYALSDAEVAAREALDKELVAADVAKKGAKNAAKTILTPLIKIGHILWGRGSDVLVYLDLSQNLLSDEGASTLLQQLWPPKPAEAPKPAAVPDAKPKGPPAKGAKGAAAEEEPATLEYITTSVKALRLDFNSCGAKAAASAGILSGVQVAL